MAIFNAAASAAAKALQAQTAKAAAQQKAAEMAKAQKQMEAQKLAARAAAATGGPKPAPQIQANIPPAIRGAQGNDALMSPRSTATTGGPKPATVSAYNPKEGVGVTASTPRPLAGQGNDMMMGSPSAGGIAPARAAAATGGPKPAPTFAAPPRTAATVIKKKGGSIKAKSSYSSGGKVGSASKRADGCAQRGKTKGRMI